jgi:hypothetical protein
MLIIGGLFALALVALALAVLMARDDKPQVAAATSQASAPAAEEVKAQIAQAPAEEEAPALVVQTEQSNQSAAEVVQPMLNEIVSPVDDGQNTESLVHAQGQVQELTALIRQLQGQMQSLEQRVNYISTHVSRLDQSGEPNTGAAFMDVSALPRKR